MSDNQNPIQPDDEVQRLADIARVDELEQERIKAAPKKQPFSQIDVSVSSSALYQFIPGVDMLSRTSLFAYTSAKS